MSSESAPTSGQTTQAQPTPSAQPPVETKTETPKPKKPRSAKQLEALARGREKRNMNIKEKKASQSRASSVVRSAESADELVERVKEELPESKVIKNKRKSYDDYDEIHSEGGGYGLNANTALKVAGVAGLAGLAYLGLKNGNLNLPNFTPPSMSSSQPQQGGLGGGLPQFRPPFSGQPGGAYFGVP